MTRGRHTNHTYVVLDQPDPDCLPGQAPSSAREVLEQILATSHAQSTATETWADYHPDQATDTVTTAACTVRPSTLRQVPSRPCTLLATTTWVCRFGSPARVSQWSNAAATIPRART